MIIEEVQKRWWDEELHRRDGERVKKFCNDECSGAGLDKIPLWGIIVAKGSSEEILLVAEKYNADMVVMGQSSKKILRAR